MEQTLTLSLASLERLYMAYGSLQHTVFELEEQGRLLQKQVAMLEAVVKEATNARDSSGGEHRDKSVSSAD